MQERDHLKAKLGKNRADAVGLQNQVLAIREELSSRDAAVHEERVQREAVLQDMTMQRNVLQAELGKLQAEVLSVGHEKQTLEHSLRKSSQVSQGLMQYMAMYRYTDVLGTTAGLKTCQILQVWNFVNQLHLILLSSFMRMIVSVIGCYM